MYIFSLYKNTRSSFSLHCGKVLSFPQFSGSAPAPEPPGTRPFAEEESASALLPRSFRFLKKRNEISSHKRNKLRSSSSAGKNGKAPRPVFLAVSPCLEAAASLSSARFRLYHILFPAGQKVKLSLPQSFFAPAALAQYSGRAAKSCCERESMIK